MALVRVADGASVWLRLGWDAGGVTLPVRAVLFDWRGTLVVTAPLSAWVEQALQRVGRDSSADEVDGIEAALVAAMEHPDLQQAWDRADESAWVHRETYARLFRVAGLDDDLAEALYAVESNPAYNPFADDVADTLKSLQVAGVRVGIVSDIHFDLRPVFAEAGLADLVDCFVLSFEQGVQKPNPQIFRVALDRLDVEPPDALMVGDRASHDGAAVNLGIPTVLVPELTATPQRRLAVVLRACGIPSA
jgi:HAD superfamily hydrolase (TIGR01549 family)